MERMDREVKLSAITPLEGPALERMVAAFKAAKSRALFLDYDGTLMPLYPYAY